MKVILFGGAEEELGQIVPEIQLIGETIKRLQPRQVLHIPFARTDASEVEWSGDWFNQHIHLGSIEYLNAANTGDIEKARSPLIFMSGGGENINLLEKIKTDPQLLDLVETASCIIGESAGAKVLGAYFRAKGDDHNSDMVPGLSILKDTVVEPHYTERKRQELLVKDMEQSGTRYGIGIDAMTAIEFDNEAFPEKWTKIGEGRVEIKIK
jgi:peptidase E